MDELLTPEQTQLRDSAARLCRDLGGAKRARSLRECGAAFDTEAWHALRDAGWLGLLAAEARGGLGLGAVEMYLLSEQIGRQVLMVPFLEAATAAWALGRASGAGASATLRAVLAGDRLVVPAVQADGWDFRAAPVLDGQPRGSALAVTGTLSAIAFANSADEFLINVDAEGEALLCLLPRDRPGIAISVGAAVDGSSAGRLALAGATIDPARIIARGPEAAQLAAGMADLLALGTAVELLGLSESALGLTLEHLKTRKQFGHPLGSFQALQHRVVDAYVDLELDRSLHFRVAMAWDAAAFSPPMVAAAKARASRSAAEIMRMALQLHGAIGYTDEHDIGIYFKRALVLAARYGNEFAQSESFSRLTREEA